MTAKRFILNKGISNFSDTVTDKIYSEYNLDEIVELLNELYEEKEMWKRGLDYIQNSITEHIKHQKTELGQKALKEVIEDYNGWLLGHKGVSR